MDLHQVVGSSSDRSQDRSDSQPTKASNSQNRQAYCTPHIDYLGSFERLIQSGPTGNRYETYPPRVWQD